jgi:putative nucleotidyltransferase with HDIG domain
VILAGTAAMLVATYDLLRDPIDWRWFILAGLTLLSGSITVKVPSIPATISVSETFVFTAVLLFGPSAGTLTVALDGFVISLWLQRKRLEPFKAVFNVSALAFSLSCSAHLFFFLAGTLPLSQAPDTSIRQLFSPLAVFALSYFLLNSFVVAAAIALESRGSVFRVWRDNFSFFSVNFFFGASVAALLLAYTREIDLVAVGIIVPLLIISYLTYKSSMGRLEDTTKHLSKLNLLYLSTIETLAMWIDAKDQITHGHIRRVQTLAMSLAKSLGVKDDQLIRAIEAAALLHDMGKLAIPEHILNKPGKLTSTEFEKMKLHASIGAQILSAIDFPYPVVPIVRHHHENWDGTGYPDGLAGTDIPIGARILAVVDCFDALTSDRPYRPRLGDEEALRVVISSRGRMYDPLVVDAFLRLYRSASPSLHADLPRHDPALVATNATRTVLSTAVDSQSLEGSGGHRILDAARKAVPVSLAVLYLYDADADSLAAAQSIGEHAPDVQGWRVRLGQGVSGWVATTRRSMINADPALDFQGTDKNELSSLKSCLSVPVVASETLAGVLTLYSTEARRFSEDHVGLLESRLRSVLTPGNQEEPLASRMRDEIQGDSLGEDGNHWLLLGELQSNGLAIVLLRVDGLTDLATSTILGILLNVVRTTTRTTDVTIRSGDSELFVVLPKLERTALESTVDRMRYAVSVPLADDHELTSALSQVRLGAALYPDDGKTLDALVNTARRRLEPVLKPRQKPELTIH